MADIAIIGLDGPGAVLGRLLKASLKDVTISGYEPDGKIAKAAAESGAVDETKRSIPEALSGAQVVVLAAPMDVTQSALQVVGQSAMPGCVVTDLCRLKGPVMQWAQRYIPPAVAFVGGHVIPRDGENPFERATYCIVPGSNVPTGAIEAVVGLAKAVGAQPYFVEAMEHDSFMAATHYLPALAAGMAVDAAVDGPSWPDVRRLWGEPFETAVATAEVNRFELSLLWSMDPSPLSSWLDRFGHHLDALYERVAVAKDQGGAAQAIDNVLDKRQGRLVSMGGLEQPRLERSSTASLLFGDWLANRRRRS